MNPLSFPSKLAVSATVLITLCAHAQQELAGAKVTRSGGDLVVSVAASRPLYFALLALSEQYGWVVDYEDPIYTRGETRDKTDPNWRKAPLLHLVFGLPSEESSPQTWVNPTRITPVNWACFRTSSVNTIRPTIPAISE